MSTCTQCNQTFIVTNDDVAFYEKISPTFHGQKQALPTPTLCHLCRQQRRMARRNERKLYNRKCDATGRQIIAIYSPDSPYTVYDNKVWWSDEFDGTKYAQDFDFGRSFFEQFYALQSRVPRPALFNKTAENSEYTNHTDQVKNCYLVMNGGIAENCYYSNWIVYARDCVDCSYAEHCELCYQVRYSVHCYNCTFVTHSENCRDSYFLYDCKGVSNSFMCVGLRQKEYCILNQQYTKEEYLKKIQALALNTYSGLQKAQQQFQDFLLTKPHPAQFIINSENCSGENIYSSKNCHHCFYVHNSQDAKNCFNSLHITDARDVYESGINCEMQIENHACNRGKYVGFCNASYDNNNIWYSDLCHNSNNLFGCIGLKGNQYCVLNKQYTKEQYQSLVTRIIAHMMKTKEWGEFFPISHSPFAYNETLAQETFPLSKEQVITQGWNWHEDTLGSMYQGEIVQLPDTITAVLDTIVEKILTCENCQKHYRVIHQELNFYRKQQLPLPHTCIECRHRARTQETTRITLWNRNCAKCYQAMQTTYPPNTPEIIYCESCYLKETY